MTERTQRAMLEDVARVAGLSRATVSRVINGSPKVSEKARQAVESAVEQLGYTPNRAARSLVTRRTDSLGLVVAEPEARVFGEPFFASLVLGVSRALHGTGIQLVLLLLSSAQERTGVERYLGAHVDGALLASAHADDPLLGRLAGSGVPTVLAGRPPHPTDLRYVDVDNRGGGRLAVEHLVARGRTRIATVTGTQDMAPGQDRLAGYRDALTDAGLPVGADRVAAGDFTTESGERGTAAVLERVPDLDAVFCASDLMAVGALRALQAAGRRVPDDVAVVGFDDSVIAESARPALTSVHQPVEAMGQALVDLLRGLIDDPDAARDHVILPTHLTVRAST